MHFSPFVEEFAPPAALISVDGFIEQANPRYLAIFGFSEEAVIGQERALLRQISHRDAFRREWRALTGGTAVQMQAPHLGALDVVWVESLFMPVRAADGIVTGVLEFARSSQAELEAIGIRGALDRYCSVAEISIGGELQFANGAYRQTFDLENASADVLFADTWNLKGRSFEEVWADIVDGHNPISEYRRQTPSGSALWVRSAFAVIRDLDGNPCKVVEYASNSTDRRLREAGLQGQADAIDRSHCRITFAIDGTIASANDRFLSAMGYEEREIIGRHHRIFVDPAYAHGPEYARFWRALERGEFQAGEYKRLGRDAREVWLQATYTPIMNPDGMLDKVVAYASVVTEERWRQSEHQGQIAAIHKAQAVISFNLDGTVVDANDRFLDIMGYRLSEVRGQPHRIFVDATTAASAAYEKFWQDLGRGEFHSGEFRRLAKDGREVWLHATYNPIFDMNGRPFRVVKYASDVTEEKLRYVAYQGQIEAIDRSQAVIEFAMDGTVLSANRNFLELFGYSAEEVVGQPHQIFVEREHLASDDYSKFWMTLRSGAFHSGMYRRLAKNGREVWIRATYNPILDLNGKPYKVIKFASDITSDVELAEAYQDAKRQAQHDAATSLPNRLRLSSFLSAALSAPQARVGVIYVDLDRFKPINDTHGHAVGDRVLGEIADRLRRHLLPDQLAARIGGDEFVIAVPDLDDQDIENLARKIIVSVREPIPIDSNMVSVGCSIGIAIAPADGRSPDELLRCADAALYRSKSGGGETYCFYSAEMNERLVAYRLLVEDMKVALDRDEFFLEYQPRFDATENKINSVEALVRWLHPTRGLISPIEFIPVAEKSGLIVELGHWVLRKACETVKYWPMIGVSVNISSAQFRHGNLVETVKSVLSEAGVEASRLELELTESVLIDDSDGARVIMDNLKRVGVRLAIDDFGTGYSSLSYLRNYPFDVLKIDRQFVLDLDRSPQGRAVVQAILGLAAALGLSVTAEGVETEEQLEILKADRCSEVQGFFLARPLSPLKITELLVRHLEQRQQAATSAALSIGA